MIDYNKRIDEFRHLKDLTVEQLCEKADIPIASMNSMRARNDYKISVLEKIVKVLDISLAILLKENTEIKNFPDAKKEFIEIETKLTKFRKKYL